jgi:hypothetical protein
MHYSTRSPTILFSLICTVSTARPKREIADYEPDWMGAALESWNADMALRMCIKTIIIGDFFTRHVELSES